MIYNSFVAFDENKVSSRDVMIHVFHFPNQEPPSKWAVSGSNGTVWYGRRCRRVAAVSAAAAAAAAAMGLGYRSCMVLYLVAYYTNGTTRRTAAAAAGRRMVVYEIQLFHSRYGLWWEVVSQRRIGTPDQSRRGP